MRNADEDVAERPMVKCVVWDLDNTLWKGVLLEDPQVVLREDVADVIRLLDSRGILQSIASRNDEAVAMARLKEAGLDEYFLAPQIGWNAKSASVSRIAEELNIGLDTFLFVDDDAFERAEVGDVLRQVRTVDAAEAAALAERADLTPRNPTPEAGRRRSMYQAQLRRTQAEESFAGPAEGFLATLDLRLVLRHAGPGDLRRAEELTVRTNQLNATGYTYDASELEAFRTSPDHDLLVAELSDRFGDYGTIGVMLVERTAQVWTLKLMLISCRVMSRGVGAVLLGRLAASAKDNGVTLRGEFVPSGRNRAMLITYRFAGFGVASESEDRTVFEYRSDTVPQVPDYLQLVSDI
ncbi:hypothetical protein AV521_25795 [Streptomyces sp. IMTB 2501]|nr:hypothetical protein AV521_25795 [Streptomyces sp. IMTB 2501]